MLVYSSIFCKRRRQKYPMKHPAGKLESLAPKEASDHAHALFEKLFLASPDAIIVTTVDGHISAASPATERLFGYSQSELIGNLVEILIPERFRSRSPHRRDSYLAAP